MIEILSKEGDTVKIRVSLDPKILEALRFFEVRFGDAVSFNRGYEGDLVIYNEGQSTLLVETPGGDIDSIEVEECASYSPPFDFEYLGLTFTLD